MWGGAEDGASYFCHYPVEPGNPESRSLPWEDREGAG